MNRGLITSYLAAGSLLVSGCRKELAENEEYHKGRMGGNTFVLSCVPSKTNGYLYNNSLEIRGLGFVPNAGVDKVVINTAGNPMTEWGSFKLTSLKYYSGNELFREVITEKDLCSDDRYEREFFLKTGSYEGFLNFFSHMDKIEDFLNHIDNCKGMSPCYIPQDKKNTKREKLTKRIFNYQPPRY